MRKITAVILVIIQFVFPVFLMALNVKKHSDLLNKGTQYRLDVSSFYIDNYSDKKKAIISADIKFSDTERNYSDKYVVIKTDDSGISFIDTSTNELNENCVKRDGIYFADFEISKSTAEKLTAENNYKEWFNSDEMNNCSSDEIFYDAYVIANVYKGNIIFTDLIVDGESIL